jgi:hypothetical protein
MDFVANPFTDFFGRTAGYTARFIVGDFEWATNIIKGSGAGSGYSTQAGGAFCKPPGVTALTLAIENLNSDFGVCGPNGFDPNELTIPAYRLEVLGKGPCDCNPLP